MLAYRRRALGADVVHLQWLTLAPLDLALLPRSRPLVLTAHDVLPREPRPGQLAAARRLLRGVDAVVVHSEHGARRLQAEAGVPPDRVTVIPHGAFDHLTRVPGERSLPPELAEVRGPVVLFFGLLRPYKGIDVLLEAWRAVEGAELWIVGLARMPLEPLRALAARCRAPVRFVPRFVTDTELPAFFRRADLVALPYREIDQSGVLYTALAFGKPLVLSRVGGFPEVGAGRLVPPGDAEALAAALRELLGDPGARERLAAEAAAAARGPHAWDAVAARTLALYERLAY
jgi:glycosyltransferase involved in cell wall biosynthesis